ncbi:hypothetical protein K523DRAFT_233291 [Schizophyllum commune Tattone D]|nr:hypothetical protein K523DRAFT_233291 [Schizophyllum commune Tattone D]
MSSPPAAMTSPKRRQGVPHLLESFPAPPTFIPATPATPGSLQLPQRSTSPFGGTTPTTPLSAYHTPPTSFISTLSGNAYPTTTSPPRHIPSPRSQPASLPSASNNPPPSLPPSQPLPPVPQNDTPSLLLSSARRSTSDNASVRSASLRSLGRESIRSGRSSEQGHRSGRQDQHDGRSPRPSVDSAGRPRPSLDSSAPPRPSLSSVHSNSPAIFPSPPLNRISEVYHNPANDDEDVLSASFTRRASPNASFTSASSTLQASTSTPPTSTLPSPNSSACPSPLPKEMLQDPAAFHRELRSARSRSRGHKEVLRSRVTSMDIPPSPSRPILPRSVSDGPMSLADSNAGTPRGRMLGKPKKVAAAAATSDADGRDSPDINEIIERTPRPARSSKSLARSASSSSKSLARSASSKSLGTSTRRSSARLSKESSTSHISEDPSRRRPYAKSFGADTPHARGKRTKDVIPPPPSSFTHPVKQERALSRGASERTRDSTVSAFSLTAYGVNDAPYKRDSAYSNDPYSSGREGKSPADRSPASSSTHELPPARPRRGASPFESLRRSIHSMQSESDNPYGGIHPDDEKLFAEMEQMLEGQVSDTEEGNSKSRGKAPDAFAVEAVRSDDEGEGPFDDQVVESDEDSDSSIDLRTPLSKLMLRDGVLSPNSKVLQQQEEDLVGSHGRGSVMSFTSAISTSSILKDTRDTPSRRVRHRDGKLLRGGLGLTTGLGWSDSEDEDAPSPFTKRVSSLALSRSKSVSNLRSTSTLSLGAIEEDVPSAREIMSRSTSKTSSLRSMPSMPLSKSLNSLSRMSSRSSGYSVRPNHGHAHGGSTLFEDDEDDVDGADEFGRSKSWKTRSQPTTRSQPRELYAMQPSEGTPSSDSTASISLPDTPADYEATPTYTDHSYNRNKDLPRLPSMGSLRRQGSTASVRRTVSQKSVKKTTSMASIRDRSVSETKSRLPESQSYSRVPETSSRMSERQSRMPDSRSRMPEPKVRTRTPEPKSRIPESKSRSSTPDSKLRRPSFGSSSIPAPPSTSKAPPLPTHRPIEMTRSPRPLQLPTRLTSDRPAVPVPRIAHSSLEAPAQSYSGLPSPSARISPHSGLPSPASSSGLPSPHPMGSPPSPNPLGPDGKPRPRTGTGMVYRSSRGGGALRTPSQMHKRSAPPL